MTSTAAATARVLADAGIERVFGLPGGEVLVLMDELRRVGVDFVLMRHEANAGIAVLPRYLGDSEPELEYLPMPDEPCETLWLTVHRDLRSTPRVRAVLDFLIAQFERERASLRGR